MNCLVIFIWMVFIGSIRNCIGLYSNRNPSESKQIFIQSFSRKTRQAIGSICVPSGTCISNENMGTVPSTIDRRIALTGGQTTTCPPGQVACLGIAGGATCGQRYATTINSADGVAPLGAFPWQAYLRNQTGFAGSGVLVDSLHVITAAHKINQNIYAPNNIIVNMGVHDPSTTLATSQARTAATIIVHPSFEPETLKNDIAIIRLNTPIALGYQINIGTACLPTASITYAEGTRCTVSGWGRSSYSTNDAPSSSQKQVNVPIVSYNTCRASMAQSNILGTSVDRFLDQNGELCAGGEANKDACTSDGGSPLVCTDPATGRFNVAGLVIWGKNCGQPGVYGVYVDIGKYRNWIDQTIASLNAG